MSQYINKIRTNAGDLQIDYNALANLPTISNPNLLINSDFRNPVNQRGKTTYTGGESKYYTIDRWCMGDNDFSRTVEVVSGGVKITNPNTTYNGTFQQIFENTLPQGTYTISVNVTAKNGDGIFYCTGSHSSTKKNLIVGVNTLTLTDATINAVRIEVSPSSDLTIEWAKLEVGTTATPFVPRIYAEELALCQRYYTRLSTTYPLMMTQRNNSESFSYMPIPLTVSLRVAPSIKYVNVKLLRNGVGGDWWDVSNVTCVGFSRVGVTLQLDIAGSYDAGIPYFLILPNSGYIEFDAEIY